DLRRRPPDERPDLELGSARVAYFAGTSRPESSQRRPWPDLHGVRSTGAPSPASQPASRGPPALAGGRRLPPAVGDAFLSRIGGGALARWPNGKAGPGPGELCPLVVAMAVGRSFLRRRIAGPLGNGGNPS